MGGTGGHGFIGLVIRVCRSRTVAIVVAILITILVSILRSVVWVGALTSTIHLRRSRSFLDCALRTESVGRVPIVPTTRRRTWSALRRITIALIVACSAICLAI